MKILQMIRQRKVKERLETHGGERLEKNGVNMIKGSGTRKVTKKGLHVRVDVTKKQYATQVEMSDNAAQRRRTKNGQMKTNQNCKSLETTKQR